MEYKDLSIMQWNAIHNYLIKGFTLQMSTLPNITFINKETGELDTETIDDLVAIYDYDLRENARMRASERRLIKRQRSVS
jgi:hypothetical protein